MGYDTRSSFFFKLNMTKCFLANPKISFLKVFFSSNIHSFDSDEWFFLLPPTLEEGHFSERLVEPGDIKVTYSYTNSVTSWFGQTLVRKWP